MRLRCLAHLKSLAPHPPSRRDLIRMEESVMGGAPNELVLGFWSLTLAGLLDCVIARRFLRYRSLDEALSHVG